MWFSITAWFAWSGQRTNALRTALLTKGYVILVRWWPGTLACRNISNDHSLRFPPLPKSCDSPFLLLQCYQLFRWVFSSNRLWDRRLLWCGSCSLRSLLLWPCNLRFCPCCCWTLPLHVKTSTFTNTNWQKGLKTITITTSFFLWRFFPLFLSLGYLWHDVSIGEFNDMMVTSVDSLDNALLHEVWVNNVGWLGCDILHAVDSWGENGKNRQNQKFWKLHWEN